MVSKLLSHLGQLNNFTFEIDFFLRWTLGKWRARDLPDESERLKGFSSNIDAISLFLFFLGWWKLYLCCKHARRVSVAECCTLLCRACFGLLCVALCYTILYCNMLKSINRAVKYLSYYKTGVLFHCLSHRGRVCQQRCPVLPASDVVPRLIQAELDPQMWACSLADIKPKSGQGAALWEENPEAGRWGVSAERQQ